MPALGCSKVIGHPGRAGHQAPAEVLAEARGIDRVEADYDELCAIEPGVLELF
jgi:hypothetical protein